MSGLNYYILDTETTGLKAQGYFHEIHELSIIRVSDKVQLTQDISCKYPRRANYDALKLTHKTIKDLYKGVSRETAIESVEKMLNKDNSTPEGRVIVAYNGAFDRRFLHALWKSENKEFPANLWLDPLKIMRKYAKTQNWGKVSLGLDSACDLMGIKKFAAHTAHTAKGDTRRTYFLYKTLIDDVGLDHLSYIETHVHKLEKNKNQDVSEYNEEDLSILDDLDF